MPNTVCHVHHLGLVAYQQAWDMQNQFAAEIAAGRRAPTLLFLEHPHTYTFGKRGDVAHLLWDQAELAHRGVVVHWVDRGGDVTYHGPGQLVGYPLLPLGRPTVSGGAALPKADYVGYIRKLEQIIIAAVAEFGVATHATKGLTGVWVDSGQWTVGSGQWADSEQSGSAKLAAIGVKVDAQGITRHGFALNVNPNMAYWNGIIGCGLEYPETSLAQLLDPVPSMDQVRAALIKAFEQVFAYQVKII